MKARLLYDKKSYVLLDCTGGIKTLTQNEAKQFILNFDDSSYYDGTDIWDYEGITIESYPGDTIAFVDDEGLLSVANAELFRTVLLSPDRKMISTEEYAKLHGRSDSIVRRMCRENRIDGAQLIARKWFVPENAPYPEDNRVKH